MRPPSGRRQRTRRRSTGNRDGYSLVEVLIAITILVCGVLALAAATTRGLEQTNRGRTDMQYSADVEEVVDSLLGVGWNKVSSGSTTIRGRGIAWTLTTPAVNSQLLTIAVQRPSDRQFRITSVDTLVLFLANPRP